MKRYIVYDIEIIKAIPQGEPIAGIQYCGGWGDHAKMGISVIGFCELMVCHHGNFVGQPLFMIGDEYGLEKFHSAASAADGLIGFNSRNFDDKVMAASGHPVTTTYDLLEQVRIAAYGSPRFQDCPSGRSYKLADLGAANRLKKTGDGANAAIEWQMGMHKKVVDYCMNDVKMTAELLTRGLEGELRDPNTKELLKLVGL